MNEDCKMVYVLPPAVGSIGYGAITPSESPEAMCHEIDLALESINKIREDVKYEQERLSDKQKEILQRSDELRLLRNQLSVREKEYSEVKAIVAQLDTQKEMITVVQTENETNLAACKEKGGSCYRFESAARRIEKALAENAKKQQVIQPILAFRESLYNQSHEATVKKAAQISQLDAEIKDLRENGSPALERYDDAINGIRQSYSHLEGASIKLRFENAHDKMTRAFQQANKNLEGKVSFVPMPVEMSLNFVNRFKDSGDSLPAVIDSYIPGFSLSGSPAGNVPVQTEKEAITDLVKPLSNESFGNQRAISDSVIFGSSLDGSIVLARPAACALLKENRYRSGLIRPELVAPHLVANGIYRFQAGTKRAYKVTYNLGEMMKRVKSHATKQGLFKTSSLSEMIVSNSSNEWLKIEFITDDAGNAPTPEDETRLRQELRAEFLQRALDKLTRYSVGYTPDMIEAPKPGAGEVAQKLGSNLACRFNQYCQFAALGLDLVSKVYGGASAVDKFIQTNDIDQSEEVSVERMVYLHGSMGFEAK